jgi:hypothetical protein
MRLQHLSPLLTIFLYLRPRHGGGAAAETLSATYSAYFSFLTAPACYMDPVFEFACTSSDGTLVIKELKLLSDRGPPYTCVYGPQLVKCTVARLTGSFSTGFEGGLYTAEFECRGGTVGSLAAAAESSVTDAACGPGVTQQVYQNSTLKVYDWQKAKLIDSTSCEAGSLEQGQQSGLDFFQCGAAAYCTGGAVAGCSLVSVLASPRAVFNSFSIPAGAVRQTNSSRDAVVGTVVVVGLLLVVVAAAIGLGVFCCCCKKKQTRADGGHTAPKPHRSGDDDVAAAAPATTTSVTAGYSTSAASLSTRMVTNTIDPIPLHQSNVAMPPVDDDVANVELMFAPAAQLNYKDQMRSHQLEHVPVAEAVPLDP